VCVLRRSPELLVEAGATQHLVRQDLFPLGRWRRLGREHGQFDSVHARLGDRLPRRSSDLTVLAGWRLGLEPPNGQIRTTYCSARGPAILLHFVDEGVDGLTTPSFLAKQLIGKFKLGNSVQALNNLTDRFRGSEYSISALM
jgi:hypothetical protein